MCVRACMCPFPSDAFVHRRGKTFARIRRLFLIRALCQFIRCPGVIAHSITISFTVFPRGRISCLLPTLPLVLEITSRERRLRFHLSLEIHRVSFALLAGNTPLTLSRSSLSRARMLDRGISSANFRAILRPENRASMINVKMERRRAKDNARLSKRGRGGWEITFCWKLKSWEARRVSAELVL